MPTNSRTTQPRAEHVLLALLLLATIASVSSSARRQQSEMAVRFGAAPAKLLRKVCLVEAAKDRFAVYTLTFANPDGVTTLGVRIDAGDVVKVCVPNFKPKSYSMSAERPGEFDITFKVYPGGRCSGYLDSLELGQSAEVFKMGRKQRVAGTHVGIVAYGVGITEALPIATAELAKPEATHVDLLWASKTFGDTFWHEQLAELAAVHPERFKHTTILSRETRDGALHGRVNSRVLAAVFDDAWATGVGAPNENLRESVRFLSVGTKAMMHETDEMLTANGYHWAKNKLLQ